MSSKTKILPTELSKRFLLLYRKIFKETFAMKSKRSSASTLLKYAGTWSRNDLEQCLTEVTRSRGEVHFSSSHRRLTNLN